MATLGDDLLDYVLQLARARALAREGCTAGAAGAAGAAGGRGDGQAAAVLRLVCRRWRRLADAGTRDLLVIDRRMVVGTSDLLTLVGGSGTGTAGSGGC